MEPAAAIRHPVDYWERGATALLTGESAIYPLSLAWSVHLTLNRGAVHIIDCAMRGNAFVVVDECHRLGYPPDPILQAITIQRAFTPYQILDVMHHLLEKPDNRLFMIQAPSKQFFDGDVAEDEGAYLLRHLVEVMRRFERRNIPLLIVETHGYNHPAFPVAFGQMRQLARPIFHLKQSESTDHLRIRVSKIDQPRGQKSILGDDGNGTDTFTLLNADRPGQSALQRISTRAS